MTDFHGLIIYEILENGNILSGVYTNSVEVTKLIYDIDSEIARKVPADINKGLEGIYNCKYIETQPDPNVVISCKLQVSKKGDVYEFNWKDDEGESIHVGFGFRVGNAHIAVSYVNPQKED